MMMEGRRRPGARLQIDRPLVESSLREDAKRKAVKDVKHRRQRAARAAKHLAGALLRWCGAQPEGELSEARKFFYFFRL
jgi:hypothetical protein